MPGKTISYGKEAREYLKDGVTKLGNAVKITLGPSGKNVVYEKQYLTPVVTNDGLTVAKEIDLKSKFENMGVQMLVEAAGKTKDKAGDGTTTATVLAQAIFNEGHKLVTAGVHPMAIKRGLDKSCEAVCDALVEMSIPVENDEDIIKVATVAAGNDPEIGGLVAEAFKKIGKEGVITVEDGKSMETGLEVVEGMTFDRGYISSKFATDPETLEAVLDDPYLLIYEKKISSIADIIPILEQVAQIGKPLFILAEDVEGEALAALVVNKMRGAIKAAAVKSPGFGDNRKEMLADIAALTGATVISEDQGMSLKNAAMGDLGTCSKIIINKEQTTIVGGNGSPAVINGRIDQIRNMIVNTTSDYDRGKYKERLAKIAGGVAVIHAGGATDGEIKEKKVRIEDAMHATRAALEKGITAGGGVAYIRALSALDNLTLDAEEKDGMEVLKKALTAPICQIAENVGFEGPVVLNKVMDGEKDFGFNAETGVYENLLEAGIADPTKVVRFALINAVSVAGVMLTTEAMIAEFKEEDDDDENENENEDFVS